MYIYSLDKTGDDKTAAIIVFIIDCHEYIIIALEVNNNENKGNKKYPPLVKKF